MGDSSHVCAGAVRALDTPSLTATADLHGDVAAVGDCLGGGTDSFAREQIAKELGNIAVRQEELNTMTTQLISTEVAERLNTLLTAQMEMERKLSDVLQYHH